MLGELLLRAGVITEEQLRTALAEQKKWGGKLGHLLVEMNFLEEDTLVKALSKQLGLPRVDFTGLVIQPETLEVVEADFAEQRQALPISYDPARKQIVVAMSDPGDLDLVDELGFKTGCRVRVAIAGEKALSRAIRQCYYGEAVSGTGAGSEDLQPMKLLTPLGQTMVRRLDSVPGSQEASPPRPTRTAVSEPDGGSPEGDPLEAKINRLEALQTKQVRVLKAVVELLIEKGYVAREEYRTKVES